MESLGLPTTPPVRARARSPTLFASDPMPVYASPEGYRADWAPPASELADAARRWGLCAPKSAGSVRSPRRTSPGGRVGGWGVEAVWLFRFLSAFTVVTSCGPNAGSVMAT